MKDTGGPAFPHYGGAGGGMSADIQVGQTYRVTHSRKGAFVGILTRVDDTWADVLITSGKAKAMLDYNECHVGESVTVRRSFCTFTPVEAT